MATSEVTSLAQRVTAFEAHLTRHEERDEMRFDAVDAKLNANATVLSEMIGAAKMIKWVLTLGVPAIVACLLALLTRTHG